MALKRADRVQVGEHVRVGTEIFKVGGTAVVDGATELLVGEGGRGVYRFDHDERVEVGFERTETSLSHDLKVMTGMNFASPGSAQDYIDRAAAAQGEHVRARYRILQRPVLTFTGEWTELRS